MNAYYNEIDPFAAAWLRNLIGAGLIAPGEVDERSITEVSPDDVKSFTQCHFFAGIGGWSLALRLAGWDDSRPIWTGSCPCQPFSVAGKGRGTDDERHLWPVFARLIGECRPSTVAGEQVASKAGRDWLASVFADLAGMGYRGAGADLCSAGVGAPNIRQRLFWVADADSGGSGPRRRDDGEMRCFPEEQRGAEHCSALSGGSCTDGRLADSLSAGRAERRAEPGDGSPASRSGDGRLEHTYAPGREPRGASAQAARHGHPAGADGGHDRLADADEGECGRLAEHGNHERDGQARGRIEGDGVASGRCSTDRLGHASGAGLSSGQRQEFSGLDGHDEGRAIAEPSHSPGAGFWSDAVLIPCADGKLRPIPPEPGLFPLAPRLSGRVAVSLPGEEADPALPGEAIRWVSANGALRGSGNAINPHVAAEFIAAFMECRPIAVALVAASAPELTQQAGRGA